MDQKSQESTSRSNKGLYIKYNELFIKNYEDVKLPKGIEKGGDDEISYFSFFLLFLFVLFGVCRQYL